ncbi:MAG: BolA family transcriptional regulator [Bdellovibrionales bacterium]|nr:BolA family transcriptional regulator [Bdellovibrionales bacterium]
MKNAKINKVSRLQNIENKIRQTLNIEHLEVLNESKQHKGHQGFGTESHLKVIVVSLDFQGKSPVVRSRMIYSLAQEDFDQGLHALTVRCFTPEEWIKGKKAPSTAS